MLNEYVAEFQSLRAELEGLLQSVASGGDSFAATDSKLRELKGKLMYQFLCMLVWGLFTRYRILFEKHVVVPEAVRNGESGMYAVARIFADCLEAFEMELRSMPASERSSHLSQLQICRDEFARLQRRSVLRLRKGI